jgi:hypothetical protein
MLNNTSMRQDIQAALIASSTEEHTFIDESVWRSRDYEITLDSHEPAHSGQDFKTAEVGCDVQDALPTWQPSQVKVILTLKYQLFRQLFLGPAPDPKKLHPQHPEMLKVLTSNPPYLPWATFLSECDGEVFQRNTLAIPPKQEHEAATEASHSQGISVFADQAQNFLREAKRQVNEILHEDI